MTRIDGACTGSYGGWLLSVEGTNTAATIFLTEFPTANATRYDSLLTESPWNMLEPFGWLFRTICEWAGWVLTGINTCDVCQMKTVLPYALG